MSTEAEEASKALETEQEFWDGMFLELSWAELCRRDHVRKYSADWLNITELDTIVTPEHDTSEHIDDVLRAFIDLATRHKRMMTL